MKTTTIIVYFCGGNPPCEEKINPAICIRETAPVTLLFNELENTCFLDIFKNKQ